MNTQQFKEKAAALGDWDDESADNLCFQWLKQAMEGNGNEGEMGLELLRIIETRCMP